MCLTGQMEHSSSPLHTQQHTRQTPQTGRHIRPTTCGLRPFLTSPDTGENHVAVMRYAIDFLMKHNITFSPAPGFFAFTLAQHKYTQRKESIQTRKKKAKHSAIYQHWISKSGPVPVSSDCWDFAICSALFIYLFIIYEGRVRPRGPQDGPLMCSVYRESARWMWSLPDMPSSHGADHSLWLRQVFEQPSVTNLTLIKLAPNYQPQTQISFNLS